LALPFCRLAVRSVQSGAWHRDLGTVVRVRLDRKATSISLLVVKIGSRSQFFNNLAAITTFLIFPSWQDLLQTLAFAKPPPRPP
jgi:hypothetical protein